MNQVAIIINKTKYALSITGPGVDRDGTVTDASQAAATAYTKLIGAGETADDVPDDVARSWMERADNMIRSGAVIVRLGKGKPAAAPSTVDTQPAPAVKMADDVTPASPNDEAAFAAMHWRSAKSLVGKMTDLDELEALHAVEEREGVKTALEERMKELNG